MSHCQSSVLPRLPWGILGLPLSCLGYLSPQRMFSVSFSEYILLGQVSLHAVSSQNVSFVDKSLCTQFLLRLWSLADQSSHKLSTTVNQCPQCYLGRALSSSAIPYIITHPMAFCCYTVKQSAGYWNVKCLLAVSQWKHITFHPKFRLDITWSAAGYWYA